MCSARALALGLLLLIQTILHVKCQDYDVTEIQCTFTNNNGNSLSSGNTSPGNPSSSSSSSASSGNSLTRDSIVARLRKPEGFRGSPLFADDRGVDPEADQTCQIRPDVADPSGLGYFLRITDFQRCGVLKRNGFVHVRVWFPQFPGVVMQSDQELIIMCKPPEPTIIENKAAGFAGSFPHGARVSGVVEETPGRLEYEVALYKEAPAARITNATVLGSAGAGGELPVDQAVPIGTKLQLRARINPDSAWKYVKLIEVTVSPDPDDPRTPGSVALVRDGCRNRDFASIIPHQPARYREKHNEVFLDFEAFLLSSMRERSTLWIHSQIKACMDASDCQPDFCLDLFEPSGHGRRRRELSPEEKSSPRTSALTQRFHPLNETQYTRFADNIEYTVLMPGELFHDGANGAHGGSDSCGAFLAIAVVLGCLLFLAAFIMCYLASRLHSVILASSQNYSKNIDELVRESRSGFSLGAPETLGYTGRTTLQ